MLDLFDYLAELLKNGTMAPTIIRVSMELPAWESIELHGGQRWTRGKETTIRHPDTVDILPNGRLQVTRQWTLDRSGVLAEYPCV